MTMHDVVPLQWPERYLRTGVVHRMLYRAVQARGGRDLRLAARRAATCAATSSSTRRA